MILCDHEIRAAITRGDIVIDPLEPENSKHWSSTTYDLRLDSEICRWKPISGAGQSPHIDPTHPDFDTNELIRRHTDLEDCSRNTVVLRSREFVLGWTLERVSLPHRSRIGARVEGKSSLARIGLGIHVTAPTIHPGFGYNPLNRGNQGSPIRLEIWNAGPLEIQLVKGMRICQVVLEEVYGTPTAGYSGGFRDQGPPPG